MNRFRIGYQTIAWGKNPRVEKMLQEGRVKNCMKEYERSTK